MNIKTQKVKTKKEFTDIEIYGAQKVLEIAISNHHKRNPAGHIELFVCAGVLESVDKANGAPYVMKYGGVWYNLSYCEITEIGALVGVFYAVDESIQSLFRIEPESITRVNWGLV